MSVQVFDSAQSLLSRGVLREKGESNESNRNYLMIGASDGRTYSISWKFKETPSDPVVGKLAGLLLSNHVGGW